ncbi:MAG: hypothetical protein ACXABY_22380 [Candidatus Thorarchaeota archaeon]|jgi:hypothetical protein
MTEVATEEVVAQSAAAPERTSDEVTIEQLREELKAEIMKKLAEQGCTEAMLNDWKEQFGPLGFMPIGEQIYVIRSLLRKEWKIMNKEWGARANSDNPPTQFDTEEEITAKATMWPKFTIIDLRNSMPAGVASTLSEAISNHAGFVPNASPIVF